MEESRDNQFLLDYLSECLQVERSGVEMYRAYEDRFEESDIRERLAEFRRQNEQHTRILSDLVTDLGGDPRYVSDFAKVSKERFDSFLKVRASGPAAKLEMLGNLFLTKEKDSMDWKLVRRLAEHFKNDRILQAVSQVEPEAESQVQWLTQKMEDIVFMTFMGAAPTTWGTSSMMGSLDPSQFHKGMDVYCRDNQKLCDLDDVHGRYLVCKKGFLFTSDAYIPFSAISDVREDRVYLNMPKDQVDKLGWTQKPSDFDQPYSGEPPSEPESQVFEEH